MSFSFDPFSPAWRDDPYPKYRELRDAAPVHWSPEARVWCVSRYDDVLAVLKNDELFSSRAMMTQLMLGGRADGPPLTPRILWFAAKLLLAHVPLALDFRDPWHTGFAQPPSYQRAALRRVRRYAVEHSELVLAVNSGTARAVGPRCEVLDNGFDPTDFDVEPAKFEGFSIVHVGNLWRNQAEVCSLVEALRQRPEAKLYLVGQVDGETRRRFEHDPQVRLLGTVPHGEACALMKGAGALLYIGKPQQPVGIKLYENLGARRPIVVWGERSVEGGWRQAVAWEGSGGFVRVLPVGACWLG